MPLERLCVLPSQSKRPRSQILFSPSLSINMSSRSKATKGTASSSSGRGKAKLTAGAAAAVASVSNNKSRTGRSPVGGASSTKSTKVTRKRLHQAAAEEDDDGATAADSQPVGGDAVSLARLQLATPQSSPSKKARSRSGDSKAAPASSRVLFGNDSAPGQLARTQHSKQDVTNSR